MAVLWQNDRCDYASCVAHVCVCVGGGGGSMPSRRPGACTDNKPESTAIVPGLIHALL
jgi:hypothetical protein